MIEDSGVFTKGEEIGHPVYTVKNEKLAITMKVEPMLDWQGGVNGTIIRRQDAAEITFINNKNPNGELKDVWCMWPYIVTTDDIGFVDVKDPDYIEEVFGKYGRKFLEVDSFISKDQQKQYRELVGKVFPDVEEKRLREGRED